MSGVVTRRDRHLWIPALVAFGASVLLALALVFLRMPIESEEDIWLIYYYFALGRSLTVLTGCLGACLAWRAGARRGQRVIAGLFPLVLSIPFLLHDLLDRSWPFGVSWQLTGLAFRALYLFLGTLPFLIPSHTTSQGPEPQASATESASLPGSGGILRRIRSRLRMTSAGHESLVTNHELPATVR